MTDELGANCIIEHCIEDAFVVEDATGIGYCVDHFQDWIERQAALIINPQMFELLPPIPHRRQQRTLF